MTFGCHIDANVTCHTDLAQVLIVRPRQQPSGSLRHQVFRLHVRLADDRVEYWVYIALTFMLVSYPHWTDESTGFWYIRE